MAGLCLIQLCGCRRTWLAMWLGTTVRGMRSSCASSLSIPSKPGYGRRPPDAEWSWGHLQAPAACTDLHEWASHQPLHVQIVVLLVWTGFCSTQALLWWEFGWKVSDVCPIHAAAWSACVAFLSSQDAASATSHTPHTVMAGQPSRGTAHGWSSAVQVLEVSYHGNVVAATAQ